MTTRDLIEHHDEATANALRSVSVDLRKAADEIDRLVAMSPRTNLRDMTKEWTPTVSRAVHHVRSLLGNLSGLDGAIENAAQYDRLVRLPRTLDIWPRREDDRGDDDARG